MIDVLQLDKRMSTTSTQMARPTTGVPLQAVKMTLEHVASVKECLIAGFLQNNEIWSAFNIKRQDVESFFEGVIRDHMFFQARLGEDKCLNTVTLYKEGIYSCKLHYELEDYIEKQRNAKPEEFELFRQLQKAGKKLTKNINLDHYPRGKTVFIDFGGINPAYHISNLMKAILFTHHNQSLKRSGYEWVVGRLSNARAMGLYKKFGAKQLSQVTFERDGKKFKLFFFEMDLNGETFLKWQANLDKIIEMEKVQIKQSKL